MKLLTTLILSLIAFSAVPAVAGPKGCPPGLAKKDPACVPPGLARKDWHRGDYVGDYDYHRIRYPDRYGLPPLRSGQRYLIVDDQILVVNEDTYTIVTVLRAVSAILD
ncbi:excinuclease ABC subunit A [Defluviimonas sp. WL0002]|uniref:Excinuclease ABC subunit A n=1 Tax=Albidovulum marisflavi TaxID=2984159 RepID=A0ABT2ZH50_9RHOB|nr:excinuclease ABC subunit A [Defluviimonas sp. WL0002]MCV2870467.1 excinuclease ABC subunit A [Defluviimonas sp. WL0002]